jgi:hypothetical protein
MTFGYRKVNGWRWVRKESRKVVEMDLKDERKSVRFECTLNTKCNVFGYAGKRYLSSLAYEISLEQL